MPRYFRKQRTGIVTRRFTVHINNDTKPTAFVPNAAECIPIWQCAAAAQAPTFAVKNLRRGPLGYKYRAIPATFTSFIILPHSFTMYALLSIAALAGSAVAAVSNSTWVTTDVTVTDYTTYCPESTVLVVKTCTEMKCHPYTTTVAAPATVTITGECVVPTSYTTQWSTTTVAVECEECVKPTSAPATLAPVVSTAVGAGSRNVVGAVAGLAAAAALL